MGRPNPEVPAGQRAYTIMAVNNGPDAAPAAKGDADRAASETPRPDYTATKGKLDFDRDADGGNGAWAWEIGEMAIPDATRGRQRPGRGGADHRHRRQQRQSPPPPRTPRTTRCASTAARTTWTPPRSPSAQPRAGNTWHSTDYYDYDDSNDTATIVGPVTRLRREPCCRPGGWGASRPPRYHGRGLPTLYSRAVTPLRGGAVH